MTNNVNTSLLDHYIEHAMKTRDLSYIRRTQHLYDLPEDLKKIDECVRYVHAWTRRIRRESEALARELFQEEELSDSKGSKNVIMFPV